MDKRLSKQEVAFNHEARYQIDNASKENASSLVSRSNGIYIPKNRKRKSKR